MAAAVQGVGKVTVQASDSTSIEAVEPTGAAEGELLVAIHRADASPTLGVPVGWSGSESLSGTRIAYIVRGASAPDLTFTSSTAEHHVVVMMRVTGYDPIKPLSDVVSLYTASGVVNTPAGGTQTDGGLMVSAFGADRGDEPNGHPAGYTSAGYAHSAAGASGPCTAGMAYKAMSSADLDDPGAWGDAAVDYHRAITFCINGDPGLPSNANSPVISGLESAVEDNGSTDITVPKPEGTVEGDKLLFIHITDNTETITQPSGFTVLLDETRSGHSTLQVSAKTAGASEPSSYTSSSGSSECRLAFVVRLSANADLSALDASAFIDSGTGVPSCPTITTIAADALVFRLYAGGDNDGAFPGFPDGSAGLRSMMSTYAALSGQCCGGIAVELKETAGVVAAEDWGATAVNSVAATFSVAPIPASGDDAPVCMMGGLL